MDAASPCLRRGLTLTQRLALSLTVGAFFVALVLGFVGAARTVQEDGLAQAAAERELATRLAERFAPLLERSDLLRLSVLATVAHDQLDGRVLVVDRDGRVKIDTALVRGDQQVGLLAGSGPFQRTTVRQGDSPAEAMQLRETLAPIRFGGEVIGELRVAREVVASAHVFDFTWFGLVLLSCLTLVVVAVMMGHYWSGRVRRATDSLIRLSSTSPGEAGTSADRNVLEAGANEVELQELGQALAEARRGINDGSSLVANGFLEMAEQIVANLERARLVPLGHGERTERLARRLAERLQLTPADVGDLATACRLVDLGKGWVRPAILQKQGPLTEAEAESLWQHPLRGAEALEAMPALRPIARILRHQSERYDGSGLPGRLRGDRIPLGARILAIASAFDLLTTCAAERPSRWEEALDQLDKARGDVFDPWLLEEFAEEIRNDPPEVSIDPPVMIVPAGVVPWHETCRLDEEYDYDEAIIDELEVLADDDAAEGMA